MNITSLQTFIAIVETGSLVRASERLNVTQSTVTARLKTLEQDLGQTVLNRQKSGITLTPAGTKLLRYARVMTGLWRQAKLEAGLPAGTHSVCNFGCHRELWYGPGKQFFDLAAERHPDMALSVYQGNGHDLEDWLASGHVDVIMTYEPVARSRQSIHPLPAQELVLYSDQEGARIVGETEYVFVDHGEDYRRWHGEIYFDAGTSRATFDSSLWAIDYLLKNGGSAYLPALIVDQHPARSRLHQVNNAERYRRTAYLVASETAVANWPWFTPFLEELQRNRTHGF
ncbi:LysR family transcriptional regulator [Coralliovum pocilloporae]|uniref:LysR family transcriptional regulator n=1 Tax=Coralliovum pocilloporae TaxID=3066369 RepID=UPI0033075171